MSFSTCSALASFLGFLELKNKCKQDKTVAGQCGGGGRDGGDFIFKSQPHRFHLKVKADRQHMASILLFLFFYTNNIPFVCGVWCVRRHMFYV